MAFKIFVGRKEKGGPTAQQADQILSAASDLENQLNDKDNGVQSVVTAFVHDLNPLHAEVIVIAVVADKPKKKEEK